jgi:hypothetical protein
VAVDCRVGVCATYLVVTACNLSNFKIRRHCDTQGQIRSGRSAGTKSRVGYSAKYYYVPISSLTKRGEK